MVQKRFHAPKQNDAYARRLQYAIAHYRATEHSLRLSSKQFGIAKSHLHRAVKRPIPFASTRGRRTTLTTTEEELISNAVLHFSSKGTPLSRECFKELVKCFVQRLPQKRRNQLAYANDKPGDCFVRNFLKRHEQITLKRRTNLQKMRADAMSPQNLAEHFARLAQAYKEYQICSPEQIFNIDESGFSVRTATHARSKALFNSKGRSNSTELKWTANAQHVTIMPVVSGDGRAWSPLVVLPGARAEYRKREDGTLETPSCYLPFNARTVYRETAGVDSAIFLRWVHSFVEETKGLRQKYRHILLTFDGYGAHCTYEALKLLEENRILAIGLPAHTIHRTQVLDHSVFSPFKNYF